MNTIDIPYSNKTIKIAIEDKNLKRYFRVKSK